MATKGYERRDASAKWIFGIVILLVIFGLSIHGILAGFFSALLHTAPPTDHWRPAPRVTQAPAPRPPFPVLQVSPPLDLQSFRDREEKELHTYGWVNRTSGVVRVPIERAMELVLQEGLPTRNATNASRGGPSSYQLMQQRSDRRQPEIQGEK